MMKKTICTLAMTLMLAAPAFANSCPGQMAEIKEALTATTVDDATKAQAQALHDTAMAAHDSGDHAAAEKALAEAKALLKI